MTPEGKIIIFSAPSGSGKSTIIGALRERKAFPFVFSVSATNRSPRQGETHGREYYFLSDEEFNDHLQNDDFVEYCEVYPGRFYGTLKSEINKRLEEGHNVVLDVDVEGAMNVKKLYGDKALAVFIMPPDIETLKKRLSNRGTESADKIEQRIGRAEYEISLAGNFDVVIENDLLDVAVEQCSEKINEFLSLQQ